MAYSDRFPQIDTSHPLEVVEVASNAAPYDMVAYSGSAENVIVLNKSGGTLQVEGFATAPQFIEDGEQVELTKDSVGAWYQQASGSGSEDVTANITVTTATYDPTSYATNNPDRNVLIVQNNGSTTMEILLLESGEYFLPVGEYVILRRVPNTNTFYASRTRPNTGTESGLVYFHATQNGSGSMFTTSGVSLGSLENVSDPMGIATNPGGTSDFTLPHAGRYRIEFSGHVNSASTGGDIQVDSGAGFVNVLQLSFTTNDEPTISYEYEANAGDIVRVRADATTTLTFGYFRIQQLPTTEAVLAGMVTPTAMPRIKWRVYDSLTISGVASDEAAFGTPYVNVGFANPTSAGAEIIDPGAYQVSLELDGSTVVSSSEGLWARLYVNGSFVERINVFSPAMDTTGDGEVTFSEVTLAAGDVFYVSLDVTGTSTQSYGTDAGYRMAHMTAEKVNLQQVVMPEALDVEASRVSKIVDADEAVALGLLEFRMNGSTTNSVRQLEVRVSSGTADLTNFTPSYIRQDGTGNNGATVTKSLTTAWQTVWQDTSLNLGTASDQEFASFDYNGSTYRVQAIVGFGWNRNTIIIERSEQKSVVPTTGESEPEESQYMSKVMAGNQGTSIGADIAFSNVHDSNGMTETGNSISLIGGVTYRIRAVLQNYGTATTSTITYAVVDASNAIVNVPGNVGITSTHHNAPSAGTNERVSDFLYTPAANEDIKVRIFSGVVNGGDNVQGQSSFSAFRI